LSVTLCSRNDHKRRELEAALPGWTIRLLDADDFPPETGESYWENARAKAEYGRRVGPAGDWMLGEDSGIEVACLGGAPGVHSARWDEDPIARLLAELEGVTERRARYVCELVALGPGGEELRGTGTLEGRIAEESRGSEGFGYDPVFVPDGQESTVAELGNRWKAVNSHRARAAAALNAALAGTASS
jgi:XTP/dITP diphosphohydrolase